MTEEQIKTIAARIAKGHGIPMKNAVFITRQILGMKEGNEGAGYKGAHPVKSVSPTIQAFIDQLKPSTKGEL